MKIASRLLSGLLGLGLVFSYSLVQAKPLIPAPPNLAATGYVLMDATTGEVIAEHNAAEQLPPASLTKLMTSYVAAEEMEADHISLTDQVLVSEKAWRMGGSKMFIRVDTSVKLEDLLRGMIIQSGNDASIAIAEHIAGSEEAFTDIMNQQATLLGMTDSHFKNATGWPAEGHHSSARDMATLARAIIVEHPQHYAYYAEKYFEYNDIRQPNRNKLLWRDPAVDGLKTGHTKEAGYCLVASAEKNSMRLISVVMGTQSEEARARESNKLLSYGFRYFETHQLYGANHEFQQVKVWSGADDEVALGVIKPLSLTIPRGAHDKLKAQLDVDQVIKAPIKAGQEFGRVKIHLEGELLIDEPLVAMKNVEEAGVVSRMVDSVTLFTYQLLGWL